MTVRTVMTEGQHYAVDPDSGCWVWSRHVDRHGYGKMSQGTLAHRRSYEDHVGPIPVGMELDHVCRNRCCVNPSHLEPVTTEENRRRGLDARGFTVDRKLCSHGHSMADAYVEPTTGQRKCRECRRRWALDWYYRQQVAS
jgi:hypothetical protein